MKYITIPVTEVQRLPFYLAAEEYVARYLTDDDCFFMWQVNPTVIFGRNQLIETEVNLDYCKEHGIQVYRRKSGGGCVYADMSNIMFSYINNGTNVTLTFDKYINMVVEVLKQLGLEAETSGRNDILIDQKKVSGNAFYHITGRNIVHGTMLFDTNMQNMVGSITPSNDKLVSKGVESVRQRITLLKDHLEMNIEEFKQFVKDHLCDEELVLDDNAVAKIREIEEEYHRPEFIYGHNPHYTVLKKNRIEKCGDIEIQLELKNNMIKGIDLKGDFFLVGDLNEFLNNFKNVAYTKEALGDTLQNIAIENYIVNLTKNDLITTILK